MKHYDEAKAIRILSQSKNVRIDTANKTVEVMKNAGNLGNGSWGKIDFLVNIQGYTCIYVTDIKAKEKFKKGDDETSVKRFKRDKINMAAMTKNAMKRVKEK